MIERPEIVTRIERSISENPVTTLLGPRQCGKTTIAKTIGSPAPINYYDLENPSDRAGLANPQLALKGLNGLVILDEIQIMPEMFEILRVLVDDESHRAKYLILGSASPNIIRNVSETLAGRTAFVDMSGFDLTEISGDWETLWLRGGFPRSFLAESTEASYRWREAFARTFLQRDIMQFGFRLNPENLRRFWTMVAHYHGQIWNAAEFARSLGKDEKTARNYLDILSGAFVVRQLRPWHINIKKRQVKSPKIYIRDSGILHNLLNTITRKQLFSHFKVGASWEGFAIEQILSITDTRDVYFWATHGGAELDLLISPQYKPLGFEIKFTEDVRTTKSMRVAIEDLGLSHLYIVHPGSKSYEIDDDISALSITNLSSKLKNLA